ncbi:MAG: cation:proton antiporter [Bdellovibrionales bacterium]
MHLITSLLILLTASRLLGRLFQALGYFAIVGEILAGFILGPAIFDLVRPSESLTGIVDLAIFLLIFAAGLEVDFKDFMQSLKSKTLLFSVIAFLGSFSGGLLFGFYFDLSFIGSVIIGLCFSITSIPVALGFLSNLKINGTPLGNAAMGSSIVIEIICLFVLGISLDIEGTHSVLDYSKLIISKGFLMCVFCGIVIIVNRFLRAEIHHIQRTQKLFSALVKALGEEAIFGVGVLFVLLFSTASEALGFHFVIGAFFGGMLLNKDIIGTDFFNSLTLTLESITKHFLTPIFFAYLGLLIKTDSFENFLFIGALFGVGYGSKIFSSWVGARLSGFNKVDALKLGLILNSRGTFDLIVADLGLSKKYIDAKVFSILVLFSILSIVFNPVFYRRLPPSQKE